MVHSIVIKECKLNHNENTTTHSPERLNYTVMITRVVGKDMEQQKLSDAAGGSLTSHNYFGKPFDFTY